MFLGIQKGAVAALKLDGSWILEMNKTYERRRVLVLKMIRLLQLDVRENTVGLFVWAKVSEGKTATEIVDELLYEYDIFITPGLIFGSKGASYVRFSLCVKEAQIEEAISRLKNYNKL
jgi:aspartate/methionine/tyrosine aminotransferase